MKTSFAEWRRLYGAGLCSLLLIVAATVLLGFIAGTAGCGSVPVSAIPTQIYTWYDLDAIRNNKQGNLIVGHYILMNHLDRNTPGYEELAGPNANDGEGWAPIGGNLIGGETQVMFLGLLEGQGYNIKDLRINRPGKDRVGLFGQLGITGVVRNIGVVNADVTADFMVGALVGGNWGSVVNCYSSGDVSGGRSVGGLVAQNAYILRDSCSTATVTGDRNVGGLVGNNIVISGTTGSIRNCHATGNVIGDSAVGGLLGDNSEGASITNSYATGSVTGETDIGGLVGGNWGNLSNSYATGSVTGNEWVGGLAGQNSHTVSNSYATGNVTGNEQAGGLLGSNDEGLVSNSYATGSVTGNYWFGGLVGLDTGTVTNCFWDIEISGLPFSDGGTGKTTAEMQDIATFLDAGWSIISVANPDQRDSDYAWNMVDLVTYPLLSWQSA